MDMPSIKIPLIKFIFLLLFPRNLRTVPDLAEEIYENNKRGKAIPIPKEIKLIKFAAKFVTVVTIANNKIREAGLHGRTIIPKKRPKANALRNGFLKFGESYFGIIFEKSKSNIKNKLTRPKKANAIGEITLITFVRELLSKKEKMNPMRSMEDMIPRVTVHPSLITLFEAPALSIET